MENWKNEEASPFCMKLGYSDHICGVSSLHFKLNRKNDSVNWSVFE